MIESFGAKRKPISAEVIRQAYEEDLTRDPEKQKQHVRDIVFSIASLVPELINAKVRFDSTVRVVLENHEGTTMQVSRSWKLPGTEHKGPSVIGLYPHIPSLISSCLEGTVLTEHFQILGYEKNINDKSDINLLHVSGLHTAIFMNKDNLIQKGYSDESMQNSLGILANRVNRDYLPE